MSSRTRKNGRGTPFHKLDDGGGVTWRYIDTTPGKIKRRQWEGEV